MSEKQIGSSFGKDLEEFPSDASSHLQILRDDFERVSPYAEDVVPEFEFSEPNIMHSGILPIVQSNILEVCNTDFDERQRTVSPTIKQASPELKEFNCENPRKNYENWIKDEVEPRVDMFCKNENEMLEDSYKSLDSFQSDRSSMNACFSPQSLINCELIATNKDSPCIVYVQKTNGGNGKLPNAIKETKQKLTNSFAPNTNEADFEQNILNDFMQKDKDNRLCDLLGYIQKETISDKSTNISESKTDEITKNFQYYRENRVCFEEKEKYPTKEIEGDLKKADLQNLTISSLSGESDYSTPEKCNFGDSSNTLEDIISEIINKTHQCDIKNIDTENVIQENTTRFTEKSYDSAPGEINFDDFLSIPKDMITEVIDKAHQYDIKSVDSECLTQKTTSNLAEKWHLFIPERNNFGDSLSNSEAKNSEIDETHECDLKNETNLVEENADFKHIERMHVEEIASKWGDEVSSCIALDAFSNISETKTDKIINEMQPKNPIFENEAKTNAIDEGNSSFKQTCGLSDDASTSNNLLLNYREKLRPRKQEVKLDNVSSLSKLKTDTLRSEDAVQLVQKNSIPEIESKGSETTDVQDRKNNFDVIYCSRCKLSIMDTTDEDEAHNTILKKNKKELNKDYNIKTLLDLFSIDQTISTNILKCLSSEEFRPGALLTEIVRFLRQESSLKASTKIKDDVKTFLEAAKDVGWIELKYRRYKLAGYVINLDDGEKEANGTASKRKKISQPTIQIKRQKLL